MLLVMVVIEKLLSSLYPPLAEYANAMIALI
jgi:hypothetical protein